MQHLNTLWRLVNAASTVKDIVQQSKTYYFPVTGVITVYLRAENAGVTVSRWSRPQVEATVHLQVPFGWRIATEQDDAGIYIVAKRRAVVGGLSNASFDLFVPHNAYLVFKLEGGYVKLDNLNATLNIAPPDADNQLEIRHENL